MSNDELLRTDRLVLRPWRPDEAPELLAIFSLPEVVKWLGDPTPWTSLEQADSAIAEWGEVVDAEGPLGTWAIAPLMTGRPVGWIVLVELPDSEAIQIGWTLHPDATGRGWATEAAAAVLEYGLEAGVTDIWATMWAHNEPSAKVARAIGMHELGVLDDPWYGTDEDPVSLFFNTNPNATPPPRP